MKSFLFSHAPNKIALRNPNQHGDILADFITARCKTSRMPLLSVNPRTWEKSKGACTDLLGGIPELLRTLF